MLKTRERPKLENRCTLLHWQYRCQFNSRHHSSTRHVNSTCLFTAHSWQLLELCLLYNMCPQHVF